MSVIEGKLVRTAAGTEGRIMAVALGEYTVDRPYGTVRAVGFVGLIRTDDDKLTTEQLEGAQIITTPSPRPEPTTPTSPGEVRR